jgi:predicted nuclease of predicted toxin-antitoxin system
MNIEASLPGEAAASGPQSGRIGASPSLYAVLARLQHAGDDAIFDLAAVERRVVESADADFGTLLAMRSSRQPSVIQFRGAVIVSAAVSPLNARSPLSIS